METYVLINNNNEAVQQDNNKIDEFSKIAYSNYFSKEEAKKEKKTLEAINNVKLEIKEENAWIKEVNGNFAGN